MSSYCERGGAGGAIYEISSIKLRRWSPFGATVSESKISTHLQTSLLQVYLNICRKCLGRTHLQVCRSGNGKARKSWHQVSPAGYLGQCPWRSSIDSRKWHLVLLHYILHPEGSTPSQSCLETCAYLICCSGLAIFENRTLFLQLFTGMLYRCKPVCTPSPHQKLSSWGIYKNLQIWLYITSHSCTKNLTYLQLHLVFPNLYIYTLKVSICTQYVLTTPCGNPTS